MEKHLRVLTVTLDYPPPVLGGYGVTCAQVCTWLEQRGHEMLVLTTLSPERGIILADSDEDEGTVPVCRILRSYWDLSPRHFFQAGSKTPLTMPESPLC